MSASFVTGGPARPMPPEQLMHFYAAMIQRVLEQHRLRPIVVPVYDGPQLRSFAVHLEVGVPAERVERLASAIALAAHGEYCRVTRQRGTLLVEIPKEAEERRRLSPALVEGHPPPRPLAIALGLATSGQPVWYDFGNPDLAHLAVGGTTGSGKSVALRWLLYRLVSQNPPSGLNLLIVDRKGHDLAPQFGRSAHLRHPVVSDPLEGARLLHWAVTEMDRRLAQNSSTPRLVIVIEEIADLMLINADVAGLVARIAQVGRTAGVHLIVTAQQPGARSLGDALTNFTARLLGRVATATQTYGAAGRARTMAERLLGHGDFLLLTAQDEVRLQIPWLDNRYLARIPHSDRVPTLEGELPTAVRLADLQRDPRGAPARRLGPADYQAIEAALVDGASVADLRGRFGIGYSRARRLHDLYWGLNGEDDEAGEEGGHHD